MNLSVRALVAAIPGWLAVTGGRDLNVGLSEEEARRRAAVLRGLLREGKVNPVEVVIDEELKDVFYALLELITAEERQSGTPLREEVHAIYQFLDGVEWPNDDFSEKRVLLQRLLRVGATNASWDCTEASPDALWNLARSLSEQVDSAPSLVLRVACEMYTGLSEGGRLFGQPGERDRLLGEFALLVGGCSRQLGRRADASAWLDSAERSFRRSPEPRPGLARVAYGRLGLQYEMGLYRDVLSVVDSLSLTFGELGMPVEVAKCRLVKAMALKQRGDLENALDTLRPVLETPPAEMSPNLHARLICEEGDIFQLDSRPDLALKRYSEALSLLDRAEVSLTRADLAMFVGGVLSGNGQHEASLRCYSASARDHETMGTTARLAYVRLLAADELIQLGRPREAEREILQALPTIEEQKMVPEGLLAIVLLRESVKRCQVDANALRELREHLRKQN